MSDVIFFLVASTAFGALFYGLPWYWLKDNELPWIISIVAAIVTVFFILPDPNSVNGLGDLIAFILIVILKVLSLAAWCAGSFFVHITTKKLQDF